MEAAEFNTPGGDWSLAWVLCSDAQGVLEIVDELGVAITQGYDRGALISTEGEERHPFTTVVFWPRKGQGTKEIHLAIYEMIEEAQALKEGLERLKKPFGLTLHYCCRPEVSVTLDAERVAKLATLKAALFLNVEKTAS